MRRVSPELSLVVPTFNEAGNLPVLFRKASRALASVSHELLIVDDASPDGTADVAQALALTYPGSRVITRHSPRGLSASILDGFRNAKGRILGVMDGDLQHDPRVLPELLAATRDADIAIGSRYAFQGRTCGWSFRREVQSRLAAALTRRVLGLRVKDPLSGFFCLRREVFDRVAPALRARGWKHLLEILALDPDATVSEMSFTFRARLRGQTKMNARVAWTWLLELHRLRGVRAAVLDPSAHRPALVLGKARP